MCDREDEDYGLLKEEFNGPFDYLRTARWKEWVEAGDGYAVGGLQEAWQDMWEGDEE